MGGIFLNRVCILGILFLNRVRVSVLIPHDQPLTYTQILLEYPLPPSCHLIYLPRRSTVADKMLLKKEDNWVYRNYFFVPLFIYFLFCFVLLYFMLIKLIS